MPRVIQALLQVIISHWRVCSLSVLTAITIFSLIPLSQLPEFPGSDKTHHFIAYGLLMFPVALRRPKYWQYIAIMFIGWSGLIELIQPFVNRYGEWLDLWANIGGLSIGLFLGLVVRNVIFDRAD